jgi:hypothetical protein
MKSIFVFPVPNAGNTKIGFLKAHLRLAFKKTIFIANQKRMAAQSSVSPLPNKKGSQSEPFLQFICLRSVVDMLLRLVDR